MTKNPTKTEAIDPVCGIPGYETTALHAERDGKTFYHCNDHCRPKFFVYARQYADRQHGKDSIE